MELNREFHRAIYGAARRPRLFELIESLRDAFEAYIQYDAIARPDPQYYEHAHENTRESPRRSTRAPRSEPAS